MSPLRLILPVYLLFITSGFSKDYLPPGGGWDYLFEGNAAASSATEALDGTWDHNNNSDQWDGTAPGTGNPGGITVVPVAGEPGNRTLVVTGLGQALHDGVREFHCRVGQDGGGV